MSTSIIDRLAGLVLIVTGILGLSILSIPYLPSLTFDIREDTFGRDLQKRVDEVKTKGGEEIVIPVPADQVEEQSDDPFTSPVVLAAFNNRLVIPKINVDVDLVEGEDWKAMEGGAWRLPDSATPEMTGGNVIISGHRFAFWGRNRRTFYYLDKLELGDEITVNWKGKDHLYLVKSSKVVWPDNEKVLAQSRVKILTLITCTPIGTANQRIIVEAIPVERSPSAAKVL